MARARPNWPAGGDTEVGHFAPKSGAAAHQLRERGRTDRGSDSTADQSPKDLLARAGSHQARFAPVLRRRLPGSPATCEGPRDGDEAVPQRDSGQVVLHEEHTVSPAGVTGD